MRGSWCPGVVYQMHSPLMIAWGFRGPQMSGSCGRCCEGCLQRSKPKREGCPWWRRRMRRWTRGGGPLQPTWCCLCGHLSQWRAGPCGPGCSRVRVSRRRGGGRPPVRRPSGRHALWRHHPRRWTRRWCGTSHGRSKRQAGPEGAGRCHLGGSEGGRWPVNIGPSGGLGRALLGG